VPGYLGANPPEPLLRARIQHKTTIKKVVMRDETPRTAAGASRGGVDTAWERQRQSTPVGVQVESAPTGNLDGAKLIVKSGAAVDKTLPVGSVAGDIVTIGSSMGFGGDNSQVLK